MPLRNTSSHAKKPSAAFKTSLPDTPISRFALSILEAVHRDSGERFRFILQASQSSRLRLRESFWLRVLPPLTANLWEPFNNILCCHRLPKAASLHRYNRISCRFKRNWKRNLRQSWMVLTDLSASEKQQKENNEHPSNARQRTMEFRRIFLVAERKFPCTALAYNTLERMQKKEIKSMQFERINSYNFHSSIQLSSIVLAFREETLLLNLRFFMLLVSFFLWCTNCLIAMHCAMLSQHRGSRMKFTNSVCGFRP